MLPLVPTEVPAVPGVSDRNTVRREELGPTVQLYGWDSGYQSWHGPNELCLSKSGAQKLVDRIRRSPGTSWFGSVVCDGTRFFAVAHQLKDCAVAMLYCNESKAGPAEVVVVIPASRRAGVREEFAFEFVAFTGFLGCLGEGADMPVHERIQAALQETDETESLVFSLSTGMWAHSDDEVLSRCVEKVAVAMLRWLEE